MSERSLSVSEFHRKVQNWIFRNPASFSFGEQYIQKYNANYILFRQAKGELPSPVLKLHKIFPSPQVKQAQTGKKRILQQHLETGHTSPNDDVNEGYQIMKDLAQDTTTSSPKSTIEPAGRGNFQPSINATVTADIDSSLQPILLSKTAQTCGHIHGTEAGFNLETDALSCNNEEEIVSADVVNSQDIVASRHVQHTESHEINSLRYQESSMPLPKMVCTEQSKAVEAEWIKLNTNVTSDKNAANDCRISLLGSAISIPLVERSLVTFGHSNTDTPERRSPEVAMIVPDTSSQIEIFQSQDIVEDHNEHTGVSVNFDEELSLRLAPVGQSQLPVIIPQQQQQQMTGIPTSSRQKRLPKSNERLEYEALVKEKLLNYCEAGLRVDDSKNKGKGVFATKLFVKNEFVIEYSGKPLNSSEGYKQEQKYLSIPEEQQFGSFMFKFRWRSKTMWIDATDPSYGIARLINHGVPPNIKGRIITVDENPRLYFEATRDIKVGEELVYDYGDRRKEVMSSFPWLDPKFQLPDDANTKSDT